MIIKPKYYGPQIPSTYAVSMTAAASGSNGITIADDDDIDFGTGDFFIHWEGSLPDWSIASTGADLFFKYQDANNRLGARLQSTGEARLIARAGGVSIIDKTTSASVDTVLTGGRISRLTYVCTRETSTAAGSVAFYLNGAIFNTQAITAAATVSISNTGQANISCSGTTGAGRLESNTISCILGNFAPTASEVLDLCTNGIPASWKWGSQADQAVTSFSNGAGGNAYGTFDTASADGFHAADATGGGIDKRARGGDELIIVAGKKYRVGFAVSLASGQSPTINIRETYTSGNYAASAVNEAPIPAIGYIDFIAAYSGTFQAYFRSTLATDYTVSGFYFKAIGATMALLPDTIPTSSATTWSDTSGNTGGGTLPAAGATKVTIRK